MLEFECERKGAHFAAADLAGTTTECGAYDILRVVNGAVSSVGVSAGLRVPRGNIPSESGRTANVLVRFMPQLFSHRNTKQFL